MIPVLEHLDNKVISECRKRNEHRRYVSIGVIKRLGQEAARDHGIEILHRGEPLKFSSGWATSLIWRHGLLSRGCKNVRPNSIPAVVAALSKFCGFLWFVVRPWIISNWPGFVLTKRHIANADSVPFNLDLHGKKTYVGKQMAQDGVVQVSGGSGSNQKRFGTLHVCQQMPVGL